MKIKFKKILPILGLLSIGVAAPIISTACSSTSETPNTDQNKPGQDGTGGGNTDQGGDGNNEQQPEKITVDKTRVEKIKELFGKLDNSRYGALSQHIDPTNNQLEKDYIEGFITSLGFSNNDADKVENVKVSLKKEQASQGAEGAKVFSADIVMTLKEGSAWNIDGLQDAQVTVQNNDKELTLNNVVTNVEIVQITFSENGTKLETKIKEHLNALTVDSDESISKVQKEIQNSLNSSDKGKVVRKVVVKTVGDNIAQSKSIGTPTVEAGNFKKANVTIFFGENVNVTLGTDESQFKFVQYDESKSAVITKQPIATMIPNDQQSNLTLIDFTNVDSNVKNKIEEIVQKLANESEITAKEKEIVDGVNALLSNYSNPVPVESAKIVLSNPSNGLVSGVNKSTYTTKKTATVKLTFDSKYDIKLADNTNFEKSKDVNKTVLTTKTPIATQVNVAQIL